MAHLDEVQAIELIESGSTLPHLDGCGRCRALVDGLRRALATLEACRETGGDLPEGLRRWARAYATTAAPTKPRSRILDLVAGGFGPAFAVRDAAPAQRSALYGDDCVQVDIRIHANRDGATLDLHGQVVQIRDCDAADDDGWTVCLVGDRAVATATDPDGEFWFRAVAAGQSLSLVIDGPDRRLVLPGVWSGGSA